MGVEVEHFFIGGLEDGGVPEIGFFPQGVLVDGGLGGHVAFGVVLDVVEGEEEEEEAAEDEDVVLLVALNL